MEEELTQQRRITNIQKRLVSEGYPVEVSELLDYTDDDTCTRSYSKVIKILTDMVEARVNERFKGYGREPRTGTYNTGSSEKSALSGAFGLNRGD
jgi:hypothetical protein